MKDKVQKIREEVERLKRWNDNVRNSTRHMTLQEEDFNRGKHSSYLEILNFIDSLQEEPVSEKLEVASKEWLSPQLDKSYAAYGETKQMELTHFDGYAMLDAIEFGAEWKEEQFEKNRLAHCDAQTEEEAEIERDFVMSIIENEHRQPTFDDAIKYGMRLQRENMMKGAVNGLFYAQRTNGEVMFRSNYVKKEGFEFGDKVKLIIIKED